MAEPVEALAFLRQLQRKFGGLQAFLQRFRFQVLPPERQAVALLLGVWSVIGAVAQNHPFLGRRQFDLKSLQFCTGHLAARRYGLQHGGGFGASNARGDAGFDELLHPRGDVTPLLGFRQAPGLFGFGFVSLVREPGDHAVTIDFGTFGEVCVGDGNLRQLSARQIRARLGD